MQSAEVEASRTVAEHHIVEGSVTETHVAVDQLSESAREELRALFNVLDSDGGGEVEFD